MLLCDILNCTTQHEQRGASLCSYLNTNRICIDLIPLLVKVECTEFDAYLIIFLLHYRQRKQPVRDKGVIPVELGAIVPSKADFDTSSEKENESVRCK